MSTFIITQLLFILQPVFSMWNNYGPYGGGGGGGGYPQGPPNNNVAIGYPTAYSLYVGRGNNGGWGGGGDGWGMPHSGGGRGFGSAIKCENGGAHIGQCRLDNDAICIALGGSCVNGACCTTPFSSLQSTHKPLTVIDGEVGEITANEGSILNEVSGESDEMLASTSGLIHTGTSTHLPTTTMRSRRTKKVDQVSTKITLSPVGPEMEEFLSIVKKKEKRKKTTTTTTPLPVHLSILLSTCASGLRPVGPCQETSDCPTLHHCQNNQICCYNIFHP